MNSIGVIEIGDIVRDAFAKTRRQHAAIIRTDSIYFSQCSTKIHCIVYSSELERGWFISVELHGNTRTNTIDICTSLVDYETEAISYYDPNNGRVVAVSGNGVRTFFVES